MESRHEQWMREKEEATMVVNRNKYLDLIDDKNRLEAELAHQKELLINLAHRLEDENQRMINLAGDALGFSEFQRDQHTVEVLAHHAKRLVEELAAVQGELAECRHRYAIKATSAEGESSILMGEIERLKAELMSLRARCERMDGATRKLRLKSNRALRWIPMHDDLYEDLNQAIAEFDEQALEVPK